MFDGLSEKLRGIIKDLKGHGTLSEANIESVLKEVRLALLEADVNFTVVKEFISRVKGKALGQDVLLSVTPAQQFIKVVRDELAATLGETASELEFKGRPPVIMLAGLQGSGKTTTTAKLARLLKGKGRNPYVVPADLARPAAVLQLQKLSEEIKVDCFDVAGRKDPVDICTEALRVAKIKGYDTVLVDTAGRLHIDAALMDELKGLKEILSPSEVLLVADSMTGQDAVRTAQGFDEAIGLTGVILTKLDSDARGGAALSMRISTGKPIKFIGVSEKTDGLEVFHPDRMAGRILGMGDVLTLVEKAQAAIEEKDARELEKKIKKDTFTLDDFREHLGQIKRMGSLDSILSMIPGFGALKKAKGLKVDEKEISRIEAIINSMTAKERKTPGILNAGRRARIARGSGRTVQDVNRLVKQYGQMRDMMKRFKKGGMRSLKNILPV
ncbi:MAG: signal recognition particle protein [Deltaproteobacteria bacterium]|nr:signal recognition particle protein [Deltaproteobacteria bacterium]